MDKIKTPYFCIDTDRLESNLRVLRGVMDRTGCKILLAQKCFSCYGLYPLVADFLSGATASGIFEAQLWHEEGRGENHVFSPAFKEEDMERILEICDHIGFQFTTAAEPLRQACEGCRTASGSAHQSGMLHTGRTRHL